MSQNTGSLSALLNKMKTGGNGTPVAPAAPAVAPGPALVGGNPFAPSTPAATAPPPASPPLAAPNPFGVAASAPATASTAGVNPFAPVQGSAPPPAPPPVPGGLINPPERHVQVTETPTLFNVEDPSEPVVSGAPAETAPAKTRGRPKGSTSAPAASSSPELEHAQLNALAAFTNLCNALARKFGS